jgi:hypothetical protein
MSEPSSPARASLYVLIDKSVEDISPAELSALKESILSAMAGVKATDVIIELFPGSTIIRITIVRPGVVVNQVELGHVVEAMQDLLPALALAMPSLNIQGVTQNLAAVSLFPTTRPTPQPTARPTPTPSGEPTAFTPAPTTSAPTSAPTRAPTGVPSSESDQCIGVRCSNHGQCTDKQTGACTCDAGWDGLDCSFHLWTVKVEGATNECDVNPTKHAASVGALMVACAEDRSDFRDKAQLNIHLEKAPLADLVCTVQGDSDEARSNGKVTIRQGMTEGSVELFGLPDGTDDGDAEFTFTVACSSADARYNGISSVARGTNRDVRYPVMLNAQPQLVPFLGAQVTITGQNFKRYDPLFMYVGGTLVSGPARFRTVRFVRYGTGTSLCWLGAEQCLQVMLDNSTGQLFEIALRDENSTVWARLMEKLVVKRRARGGGGGGAGGGAKLAGGSAGGGGGGNGGSNGVTLAPAQRYDASWWTKVQAEQANRSSSGGDEIAVYDAAETFAEAANSTEEFELTNVLYDIVGFVAAGPMLGRQILGKATMDGRCVDGCHLLSSDPSNTTFMVLHEFVQPFNFTIVSDTAITLLMPSWYEKAGGYASFKILTNQGPESSWERSLLYSQDCPRSGWYGTGVNCRPCPRGGYALLSAVR